MKGKYHMGYERRGLWGIREQGQVKPRRGACGLLLEAASTWVDLPGFEGQKQVGQEVQVTWGNSARCGTRGMSPILKQKISYDVRTS